MASDPLEAHLLRLGRAYGHLETMGELIEAFLEENRYRLRDDFQFDEGSWWYVGFTVEWPDPSPEWGLLIGEAMHQFRSTLDNLVWSLVSANEERPSDTSAFPICSSEGDWIKRVVHTRRGKDTSPPLMGVSDDAFDAIHDRQPYKRRKNAKRHPLAILNWLSNVDKHQVAHVSTLSNPKNSPIIYYRYAEGRRQLLREYRFSPGKRLHGEAQVEMFRVRLPRTFKRDTDADKVEVEDISIDVAFSPRRYLLSDLKEIAIEVTDILLQFAKLFFPGSSSIGHLETATAFRQQIVDR